MAYTTINKSTDYFNTKLYSGNGSTQSITGVGFQPDWTWIKNRTAVGEGHHLYDAVRGVEKRIRSDSTAAESTVSTGLTAFGTDGFTVGTNAGVNGNGNSIASWNWKANGAGSSNTDGSITSTVSVNTTAGFSIVRWSGSAANATIGHGLGAVPKMIICKDTNDTYNWGVYHQGIGNTKYLYLNTTAAEATSSSLWNNTTPTSTVFSVGNAGASNSSGTNNMIAYCFADKKGFSKFGSYTGNGNADGTFVYTGFKPAFVMVKQTNTTRYWSTFDNKRDGFNPTNRPLFPNASDQESDSVNYYHDILSNGFKWRTDATVMNESGGSYIYMAFAAAPLVGTNNIPANAR